MSQQGNQILPMVGGSSAVQEQIRQLSAQQRALAEQLERLRAETQSAGAGELAGEARDLANQLESGRLDRRTVERQERLYRRMLDAGRTLQGEEQDEQKERQSTTATEGRGAAAPGAPRATRGWRQSAPDPDVGAAAAAVARGPPARARLLPAADREPGPMRRVLCAGRSFLAVGGPLAGQTDAMARAFEQERRGNLRRGAEAYAEVLKRSPDNLSALLGLERALTPLRREAELAAPAEAFLARPLPSVAAYSVAMRGWAAAGRPDSVAAVAARWARAEPGSETPYREWGNTMLAQRDPGSARRAYLAGREQHGRPGGPRRRTRAAGRCRERLGGAPPGSGPSPWGGIPDTD